MRTFDIIVAADEQLGIAKNGALPWHLPGDLKHFKVTTSRTQAAGRRNAVIMGRKTWSSIDERFRPLPGRLNIVLSRQDGLLLPEGVLQATSLQAALALLDKAPFAAEIERVFVVGGGEIYRLAVQLPSCRRILITRVSGTFACDTHFAPFEDTFECEAVIGNGEHNAVPYRIEVWRRL